MKKIFAIFAAVLFAGSMMATDILNTNFKVSQGDWTIDNKELGGLEYVWQQNSQYGMKASAYANGTNNATESWLVSPAIDLSGVQASKLIISHARKYGELSQLSVKAKAGDGEWANLEVSAWPDGSSWDFIDAEADLTAYAGKANVQIAFAYTSSAEAAATWEIASAVVTDGGEVAPLEVISVAKALEIGDALEAKAETEKKYIVEGFITNIVEDGVEQFKNMTFWMADAQGTAASNAEGALEVYRGKTDVSLPVGTKVAVECTIKKFANKDGSYVIETGTAKVSAATGVENVVLGEKAQKVMIDGNVYVIRNNKLFNLQGAQVR